MKIKKNYFKFLLLTLLISFTGCQKDDVDIDTNNIEQNEIEFTKLIYNGKTYTKQEANENQTLLNLAEKSEFRFTDITEDENFKQIDLYVYDTNEDFSVHNEVLKNEFKNEREINQRNNNGRIFFHFLDRFNKLVSRSNTNRTNGSVVIPDAAQLKVASVDIYQSLLPNGVAGHYFFDGFQRDGYYVAPIHRSTFRNINRRNRRFTAITYFKK